MGKLRSGGGSNLFSPSCNMNAKSYLIRPAVLAGAALSGELGALSLVGVAAAGGDGGAGLDSSSFGSSADSTGLEGVGGAFSGELSCVTTGAGFSLVVCWVCAARRDGGTKLGAVAFNDFLAAGLAATFTSSWVEGFMIGSAFRLWSALVGDVAVGAGS